MSFNEFIDALKTNNANELENLYKQGFDIHIENYYALKYASTKGLFKVVKMLIENGADIHNSNDYPIRIASQNGHLKIVKYLVEKGANINAEDNYALNWSIKNGHLEIVKYLIEQGAEINDFVIINAVNNNMIDFLKSLMI